MRVGFATFKPGQSCGHWANIRGLIGRRQFTCSQRHGQDLNFAQAIFLEDPAPVALGGNAQRLGNDTQYVYTGLSSLCQFHGFYGCEFCAIHRDLNHGLFDAKAGIHFQSAVMVPNLQLSQFVDFIEIILNPGLVGLGSITSPHINIVCGMIFTQHAGTVNRLVGTLICAVLT